jgi:flagellar biosynthetic protein FliP
MYASFVVLFPAYWLGSLSGHNVMLAGHLLMLPAMALAMLHRREEYVHD